MLAYSNVLKYTIVMDFKMQTAQERSHDVESFQSTPCAVAMISPNNLIAEGISQGLEQHSNIRLEDRFLAYDGFLDARQAAGYDIVLINGPLIQYPLADFFKQLLNKSPQARIIVFAAEADHQYLKSLMRAGVYGFVPLDASVDELCNAILAVKSGLLWFKKTVLDEMVIDAIELERLIEQSIRDRISVLHQQLTKRECDVFSLVMEGLSTKEIAAQIHMSEPTVKQHLTRLFKKFDANNRSQLILHAFERVCPVTNMIKLFRRTLDRQRSNASVLPLIPDPLR
jgi:DNA-binding NarL/FixJ family response regulator